MDVRLIHLPSLVIYACAQMYTLAFFVVAWALVCQLRRHYGTPREEKL
jgi:hypothetical protein